MKMAEDCLTGCIVVLCGIPASGKSTLCQSLCLHVTNQPASSEKFHVVPISYDTILPPEVEQKLIQEGKVTNKEAVLEATQTQETQSAWKSHRQWILICVDSLIHSISTKTVPKQPSEVPDALWKMFTKNLNLKWHLRMGLSSGYAAVVIDDNMYYGSMRYQYYQLARKYSLGYCQIFMACDMEGAKKRNSKREESVPSHIIEEMALKMEPPDPDKNKWELNSLTLDARKEFPLDMVIGLITQASQNPVQPLEEVDVAAREESRQISSQNQLHQIDQVLRKIVTAHIQSAKGSMSRIDLKDFAQKVNNVKNVINSKLKEGVLRIPADLIDSVYEASKDTHNPLYLFIETIFNGHIHKDLNNKVKPL